jgi:hypothetical protein
VSVTSLWGGPFWTYLHRKCKGCGLRFNDRRLGVAGLCHRCGPPEAQYGWATCPGCNKKFAIMMTTPPTGECADCDSTEYPEEE